MPFDPKLNLKTCMSLNSFFHFEEVSIPILERAAATKAIPVQGTQCQKSDM
jgi:hypothetical protein